MDEGMGWWPTYVARSNEQLLRAPTFSESIASFLRAEVIGQDHVIRTLVRTLTISRLRAQVLPRPLGFFFLLGPTGVGKSQLTRRLAELFFGDRSRILPIACAPELTPEAFVQALLPVVRFRKEDEGLVADVEQVLVLENADKSPPALLTLLNHIVDVGQLAVQAGQTLRFARSCLILESRQCSEQVLRATQSAVGFQPHSTLSSRDLLEEKVDAAAADSLSESFGVELLQRLDGILVFRPLEREVLPALLDKLIQDVCRQLGRCGVADVLVHLEGSARSLLLQAASNRLHEGGWALRKLVREHVTYPVVDMALSGLLSGPATVRVDEQGGNLQFTVVAPTPSAVG